MINLINKTAFFILLISIILTVSVESYDPTVNEPKKYALLIGGGTTDQDTYDSFFKNIEHASNPLLKLGYYEEDVKVLFYGGKRPDRIIVEGNATKKIFLN